jgi:hypothetical protein
MRLAVSARRPCARPFCAYCVVRMRPNRLIVIITQGGAWTSLRNEPGRRRARRLILSICASTPARSKEFRSGFRGRWVPSLRELRCSLSAPTFRSVPRLRRRILVAPGSSLDSPGIGRLLGHQPATHHFSVGQDPGRKFPNHFADLARGNDSGHLRSPSKRITSETGSDTVLRTDAGYTPSEPR